MHSRHRERPRFAARLMPDQRMHDLGINSERACGHERCEVHDIRFIDGESVCVLDGAEVIEHRAANVPV